MLDENEGLWKGLVIIVQIADILYCIEVRRSWERDWFCSKNSAPYALLPVVADGASHWLVFVSLENGCFASSVFAFSQNLNGALYS